MRILGLGLCAVLFAGCSTITTGTTQPVSVVTPGADGATCEQAVLPKSQHSVRVFCRKECYTEGEGIINSTFEEMTAGNLLVGGVVGVAVDASSGAMNRYDNRVEIAMNRVNNCKQKKA